MRIPEWLTVRHLSRLCTSAGVLTVFLFAIPSLCYSAALNGTVTNKTTNRPDAGADVTLIALTQGMQEVVGHTRADSAGRYSIEVPGAGMHLIRVEHQKVAYFAAVSSGKTQADLGIYDVAPSIPGVATEADMRRVETDQQGLRVVESYFVNNESSPPRTRFSPKAYEIYLPADAQLDESGAMGPEGMPVASSLAPGKQKGQYAFVFPLRPGQTRFQVSYHLPYSGSYTFQSRVSLPTANLAVALPTPMGFTAGNNASFQSINGDDPGTQIFVARNVAPSQSIAFTVSGNGALPQATAQNQGNQPEANPSSTISAPGNQPAIGSESTTSTPNPLNEYKWWILTGIALAFVIAAILFLLRSRGKFTAAIQKTETAASPATTKSLLLVSLKEELFALETKKLQGKLSEQEYRKQKAAIETVLKRSLPRTSSPAAKKKPKRADAGIS